jgi:hypothetical protein
MRPSTQPTPSLGLPNGSRQDATNLLSMDATRCEDQRDDAMRIRRGST